jgi:hypothetical protein
VKKDHLFIHAPGLRRQYGRYCMGGGRVGYPHFFANPAVESAIQDLRKKTGAKVVS